MATTLDDKLVTRINGDSKSAFQNYCSNELKRDYQLVVREMVDAMIEGRLTITPTDAQKQQMGIYGS